MPPDTTEGTTKQPASELTTAKGTLVSKFINFLHTAETDIAADAEKLEAWVKAEIHKL